MARFTNNPIGCSVHSERQPSHCEHFSIEEYTRSVPGGCLVRAAAHGSPQFTQLGIKAGTHTARRGPEPYKQVLFNAQQMYTQLTGSHSVHVVEAVAPPALTFYAPPSRAEIARQNRSHNPWRYTSHTTPKRILRLIAIKEVIQDSSSLLPDQLVSTTGCHSDVLGPLLPVGRMAVSSNTLRQSEEEADVKAKTVIVRGHGVEYEGHFSAPYTAQTSPDPGTKGFTQSGGNSGTEGRGFSSGFATPHLLDGGGCNPRRVSSTPRVVPTNRLASNISHAHPPAISAPSVCVSSDLSRLGRGPSARTPWPVWSIPFSPDRKRPDQESRR